MSDEASFAPPPQNSGDNSIDVSDGAQLERWASKFDASPQQIRDAVQAVGASATDVEEHLKGSRATTNAEKVKAAGGN